MLATRPAHLHQDLPHSQDLEDEAIFDLDEEIPEPYLHSSTGGDEGFHSNLNLGEVDQKPPLETQIPTNTGYDLSLVTPYTSELESRYKSAGGTTTNQSRSLDLPRTSVLHHHGDAKPRHKEVKFVDDVPPAGPDAGSSIKRRSIAKYAVDEMEDATEAEVERSTTPEQDLEVEMLSPHNASVPIQILSPGMHSFMSRQKKHTPNISEVVMPATDSQILAEDNDEHPLSGRASPMEYTGEQPLQMVSSSPTDNNPIVNPFINTTLPGTHQNGFRASTPSGGVRLDASTSFMGNPFASGPVTERGKQIAEAAGDIQSYVGGLDGGSGYDPSYVGSFSASLRGANSSLKQVGFSGPMSFSERLMMEEMQEAMEAERSNVT